MAKPKALVLIDGSNVYFAQKKMGVWLDWKKVKTYLNDKYRILDVKYYAGVRQNDEKTKLFLDKLKRIGFHIKTKKVKVIIDETKNKIEKANFDVEITDDALTYEKSYDVLILFSGDSDFLYLSYLLKKQGRKMEVFASKRNLSWELKLKVKYYLFEEIEGLTRDLKSVTIK